MDQIIEVTRHSSFEGVHHKVHSFLHHLHLCNNVKGSRVCSGRMAHVLSLRSTRGITAFQPLSVSPLSTSTFLVFLLGTHSGIFLPQLFFKVLILFSETFHCCREGLDLPLQGSESRLVSLNVVSSCHRASKYHATLCLGSDRLKCAFPTDDAEKPPVSYTVLTYLKQHLHNTKREDLTKSTDVGPAKYPLKVKLELLTTLECQSG